VAAPPSTTPTIQSSPEETARQREALRRKIGELNTQEKATPPAPAPVKAVPAPPQATPVVKPPDQTTAIIEAEKKAAAAEEKRLAEEAKAKKRAAAKEKKRAAAERQRLADEAQATQQAAAEAKAREDAQKSAAGEAETRKAESVQVKPDAVAEVKPAAFAPLETPPPAVPASKEAKLADLLRKYKADEITPKEYHQERARILAEP